jgi:hypothetical protein
MSRTSILDAVTDPHLFGAHFRDPSTWSAWRAFLAVLFGLPLTDDQREVFRACTGREEPQHGGHREAWLVCGRRAGKSFILALVAVYLATFRDWRAFLGPGEVGTIMVVATDRRQARVITRYVRGLLQSVLMLAQLIESETAESITLSNHIIIEVHACSFRSTRGYTIVAALLDEIAFWPTDDSADPDHEVINAVRPGLGTIPGSMLLCASSPYARKGALWEAYRKHHGNNDSAVLCWQAPTRTMNPAYSQAVIDAALADDPARNTAEYLAQFRTDVESYIGREAVEACVSLGIRERAPLSAIRYSAFVDPSGGSADSMTLAIAHRDGDGIVVLDCVREVRPPFSPESVTGEFATVLRSYRITKVTGDRYAGEWPREQFRKHGITYELAAQAKSDLYRDLLPLINSRRVELLDHTRLLAQLTGLERRTARGGRDSIDHAPGGHDDLANCVAGAVLAAQSVHRSRLRMGFATGADGFGWVVEVDPVTYRPLDEPPRSQVLRTPDAIVLASAPGNNDCHPGRGLS